MKDNRPPKGERTLKCGDARDDGKLFWAYVAKSANGEDWLSPDAFALRKAKRKAQQKEYRKSYCRDKEKQKAYNKEYSRKNKKRRSEYRKKNKERTAEYYRGYSQENKEKTTTRHRERARNDPDFRFRKNLRTRLWRAVRLGVGEKCGSTLELTGCSWAELRSHLESQFTEGMTWENYGEWHVDHIRPCASFDLTVDKEQKICFNYTNLQPLWAADNLSKSDKY